MCKNGASFIDRANAMRQGLRDDATQVLRLVVTAEKAQDIRWMCEFYVERKVMSKATRDHLADRIRIDRDQLPVELADGLVYWILVPLEFYGIDRQSFVLEQQREHDRGRCLQIPVPDSDHEL